MTISRDQLQVTAVTDTDPTKDAAIQAAADEARQVETGGRRSFFDLRRRWSTWMIVWISVLIFFNSALAVAVGAGALDFREYQWFITAVTVETFLQIVALGAIAVRFLFSSGDSQPPG